MMGRMRVRSLSLLSLISLLVGCGDDQQATHDASPDAVDYSIGDAPQLAMPCSDALADLYTLPLTLPAMDDSHRGDVFRCTVTEKLTVPEIKAQIEAYNAGYANATAGTVNSGFWTYRIAYRTTRNTVNDARAEGDTAATLIIPAKPLAGAPLVVFGHGSVGFAEKCAPTRLDLTGPVRDEDYPPMLYRLAAYGFTVIAPDYSGFAYGQPPGYFNAEDEAHAILDATRAAAKLLPTPPDKVVFVGHSQGGHAVLSAHSYAKSYGMAGTLVGVAAFAPFWNSMSLWAAATTPLAGLTTQNDTNAVLYAMAYAYSAGELRDGAGHGVDVFQAAKQTAAREAIVGGECYDTAKITALGATPADFFDPAYVSEVGGDCAVSFSSQSCTTTLAMKWKARWIGDRPAIDAMSAPILAVFGGMDAFVPLPRAACGRNKIEADLAAVTGATTTATFCLSSNMGHRDLIRGPDVDYVNQWIAAKAGAGTEPAACMPFPSSQVCGRPPNDF